MNLKKAPRDLESIGKFAIDWIANHVPVWFRDGLDVHVQGWLMSGENSVAALWLPIVERLQQAGLRDPEIEACRLIIAWQPSQIFFKIRLADLLHQSGRTQEARQLLLPLSRRSNLRSEIGLRLLEMGGPPSATADLMTQMEKLLLNHSDWSEHYHNKFVAQLIGRNQEERARAFVNAWGKRWTVDPKTAAAMNFVIAAVSVGLPQIARPIVTRMWPALSYGADPLLGHFDGTVASYQEQHELALLEKIDRAFAENQDPVAQPEPEFDDVPPSRRVVFVSFGNGTFPNDLGDHFLGTAHEAQVELHLALDNALVLPEQFIGTDEDAKRRCSAFIESVARIRPDLVIIDCFAPMTPLTLTPSLLFELKRKVGFRLACVLRDAHQESVQLMLNWLPACDTMVVFDPASPIFDAKYSPLNHKVTTLPVPAMHPPFLGAGSHDRGLVFVGALSWKPRSALLAVLLTEDINFTAIIGSRRLIESRDTASYSAVLRSAQAILNFSRHGPGIHLVTARVWETFAAGTLLVEQRNPSTEKFFTPYRHYLPWDSVEDIVHIAHFIKRRPDQAARISQEGHAWAQRHYNAKAFWAKLLGHALRPLDAAPNLDQRGATWRFLAPVRQLEATQRLYNLVTAGAP